MPNHHHPTFDLRAAVRQDLLDRGFAPDLPPDAARQLASLDGGAPSRRADDVQDLRALPWSSIDNDDSRDLDQIEVAERVTGGIRVRIGVADVDHLVTEATPLDAHARENATSVYTGVETFPMLPEELSTNLTCLAEDGERSSIVVEFVVAPDGTVSGHAVCRALVRNRAKLAYDGVGAWLESSGPAPAPVAADQALADQLRLQHEAAQALRTRREAHGALELDTIEATPVVTDGTVTDLTVARKGFARALIEDFMIAANTVVAQFLTEHKRSSILRVVRSPERWPRIVVLARSLGESLPEQPSGTALAAFLRKRQAADPQHFPDLSLSVVKLLGPGSYTLERPGDTSAGHFGLAVQDYTHSTAPNRRYADLVTQRIVKAALASSAPPYTDDQLTDLAQHCTTKEDDARHVERLVRKQIAAVLLADRIGDTFDGIITGVTPKGTFARLLRPPAEGIVDGVDHRVDVGDRVRLRLVHTDPRKGYVDFRLL
ncbi:MAG: RNB domain-containing ribonuclease [Gemmatimonadaceae bacterium]